MDGSEHGDLKEETIRSFTESKKVYMPHTAGAKNKDILAASAAFNGARTLENVH